MSATRIILDVWGGELSQDHVARFVRPIEDAWEIAKGELTAGNLVNLRQDAAWGNYGDFDTRQRARPS